MATFLPLKALFNWSPLHMEITAEHVTMSPSKMAVALRGFGLGEYVAPITIDLTIPSVEDQHAPPGAITVGVGR